MASALDVQCIVNILKVTAEDYMNKRHTRSDKNKSEDSPICTPEYVQVLLGEVV